MSGHEQLTPFAVFEKHRSDCSAGCSPWSLCATGAILLERASRLAAERIAPLPTSTVVIDLPGHVANCARCNGEKLCPVGRDIADERATAWIDAGVRRQDGPPC